MNIAVFVSLLLLAGCATVPPAPVEMQTLASGSYAATTPDAPEAHFVRDAAAFRVAWASMIGEGEAPQVDFESSSVVILLGGERLTGGWTVEPQSAQADDTTVSITAVIKSPPARSIVTHALTSPWAVVVVPKRESLRSVRWER
ncbi:MAG TPA: protease complex subunit PrcB family protein [Thermoanaerobaculia bacterium]